jgi:hypothetical protein
MPSCEYCGIPAVNKCDKCSNVFYCSKEHKRLDWKKAHMNNCKCYEVRKCYIKVSLVLFLQNFYLFVKGTKQ